MKRNPGFKQAKGDLPYIEQIDWPVVQEYAAAVAQFRTGAAYSYAVKQEEILGMKRELPDLTLNPLSIRLVNGIFPKIRAKHGLAPGELTWFLPHYSSEVFRQELYDRFLEIDFPIPFDAWFTNLAEKGNTGSASIFIMLEELVRSGRIAAGDRILCFVPESARFSAAYALLTAVDPSGTSIEPDGGPSSG